MKRTLTTLLILLTCSVAHANPYQYEGGIAYGQVDYDVLGAFEDKSVIGHLNYYFAPVDPGFYPYKEAAFANRASRVHAGYRQVRGEFTRKKVASLGGEAFVGGFYAYANVDFNKWDRNRYVLDKFHPEFGKDDYSKNNTADGQLAVGYMPVDNWLLSASFDFVKDQQTLSHDARKDQKTYAINSK